MAKLLPDQSFYPSPKMAMQAAPEKLAYVAMLNPKSDGSKDAMAVVDLDLPAGLCLLQHLPTDSL